MDLDNLTGHEKWDLILKNQAIIFNALDTIQVVLKYSDESIAVNRKSKYKQNTNRWLYKENYNTGKYIKVGIITEDNEIEFYPPKISSLNKETPTLYSTSWYVEPKGYEGTEQYLGIFPDDVSNAPQEIIVKRNGLVDKVTGYLTKEGKVIYYDQYLGD